MVKKWAEVESSEAYQKLPETEKTTAKEQYFSQVVAPKVPEADVGIAREQFFNYVSGSAPKAPTTFQGKVEPQLAAKPTQDFTTYDPMGSDLGSSIMDVAGPERSVMNGVTGFTGAPVKQTPVKPEVLAAFEARYDAATPKQRKVMEAQPNWMGDIARQRAQESARMDVAQTKAPSLTKVDPRVEARRLELIGQGEKPEFAEVAAQDAAEAGVPVGQEMAYARSKGVLEPTKFDFEMLKQYQNAPAIVRGAVQGYEGFKQGALGVNQALAELVGADDFARTQAMGAEESRGKTQSMGENANYLGRMFEGAISSIAQQLPSMVGGALTGSEALVLGSMFVNTFGQEYSDSRAKGQDGAEAASRAGLFGAFEVIGERFGMKFELDNIRRAASGMKTDQLKDFLANTLKKELPGEYLTTTGQFLVDKSAIGLNKDATLKDYLQQMADTTVQTLMQGGTMTAGTKAIEYAASKLPTAETEPSAPSIPSAEQLMRERGFLQGKSTKKEMPLETEGEEKAIRTAGAPETRVEPTIAELTPEEKAGLRQKKVEELATQIIERQGLPAEDAMRIAEGKLRAQEELDIKRQDRKQEEVENRETLIKPSETRVEELTDGFIGAGMHPTEAAHRATLIAQEEAENDKLAETEAKGAKNAGKPITATGGAGTGVSSERTATVPTGGTTTPVTARLGDTGANVGEPSVREAVQSDTLNEGEADVAQAIEAEQTEEEKQEAPAAGAPKKRGRPALPLELKTASEQKRVQQRAAYKATEKQLNKAEQMFADANAPIDEGAVESEEQLREMVDNKRRDRNAAIRTLYDISKANRGKPGQRAAELLKHPSITQRELVEAAQGHELRKKAAVANISGMSKAVEAAAADTVADDKLGKVTNGAQAITHIIKTGNEFQKILARRIRSTVSGVKIVVVEKNQPTPAIFLKNPRYEREWNRARAVYVEGDFTKEKVVYVRGASFGEDQGVNNITILHELLHAATNRKIQLAQQAIVNGEYKDTALINAQMQLVEVMNNASSRFDELVFTGKLPEHIMKLKEYGDIFSDPREFLAYGMTDPAMQDFLKTAYGQPSPVGYFNQFVDSIRNFFGMDVSDSNALADLINATDSILSARPVGKLEPLGLQISRATLGDELRTQKEINKEVDIDLEKIRISRQAEKLAREVGILQTLRDPRKIIPAMRRLWKGATYEQRVALVKPVTTEFLAAWGGTYIPELKNTNVLLEKMSGMTQQLLHSAAILAQTVHKAFKEDTTLQSKLEEVAYASTLAEIDPSDPNAEERSPKLDKLYTQLGFKGQQLFTLIKEHYENLSDYFGQLLDDQIINSRISDDAKNTLMAKIRQMYEAGKKITPYFPLVRRGDYWLAVDSGKHRKFFTFETMAERDAAAEGFAKERRTSLDELKADSVFVLGNDIGSLRNASFDSSDLLKGLFEIIDRENFGDLSAEDASAAKDALKDAVYQLYLTTMPEQSFRRQFISRKNITGFSTDLLRNLSTTGVKMSTQLARIKYSPLLRNSLSAARDSIAGREELEPFIKEMEKRVSETLNPGKDGAFGVVANVLNRAAFLHYLSGASSALLQPLGVFQTGTPILMSRYGVVGATVELTRMLKVWDQYGITRTNPDGSQSFVPPSIANATGFTPDEKRAVREMLAHDVSQSTYASALFGYKSAATINYGSVAERGKRAAATLTGGLLHSTERLSREMLFMASYRLNIKNKATHQQAVNNAVRDTNEALGNYGAHNRPPMMKKGLGKVMLQFTMYPVHTTLFLLRNFKKSLPLLNKEGKWEATKIFYGTLGTTYILAGAVGLPMFSMIMGLLGWAWRDEDKPQELQDMDYETWWRTVWLPEKMGHITIGGRPLSAIIERGPVNGLTGLDISSRTSLNDLWLRDTKETKTARESALALAVEKAGPSANMILSYADAYEAFTNGDYQKGVEKISPALVRNFVMTHKYATEGAKDNKGAEIMAQGTFTSGELLGQAIGFRSDLLANTQRVAFKMNAIDQRVNNERTKTLNNLAREYLVGENTGKWDGYLKQLEKREKFNSRYPEKAITEDQLVDSLDKRQQQRGEAWAGVTVDEKSMPYAGEAMLNITKEIERREKEMGKRK